MKWRIKNMVGDRCIRVVREELKKLGLHYFTIELGEVDIIENISAELREKLKTNLSFSGLELMGDRRTDLVEKIQNIIIEGICNTSVVDKTNFRNLLSDRLHQKYTYLSKLISEVKGVSLRQLIIIKKVERIKELLLNDDLKITEIAFKLNYSSVAHLSNQFKKITGLSPVHFKLLKEKTVIQEKPVIYVTHFG